MNSECNRCGEPFAKVSTEVLCRFCSGEIRHNAVTALVEIVGNSDRDKLSRANAVDALRILGHSKEEVVYARARAFDGHSIDQILEGLCRDERDQVAA